MTEKSGNLFEKQKKIYPRRVWGKYRIIKWIAMITLLGIYYFAPFLRWDRGPNVPDQAILIDLVNSRAYFFFIEIWPQEIYLIAGLLIFAAIALFFVTSLFGRAWCGYACPQTVWTDLFVWVERIIQGDRNARIKLDNMPLCLEKIWKKLVTHSVWLLIGLATGGAWVFYFNDAPTLLDNIIHLDVPWSIGVWISALTCSTYLMAGYAREQVCTHMCPYARFQSAMFDAGTLIVSYDQERGEPRGKHKKGSSWENRGHCIDCTQCVVVCPMGIDIREGLQMECISCGLCVDACNNVMDKKELPRGLIGYDTEANVESRKLGSAKVFRLLRTRTIYYMMILTVIGGLMMYSLMVRSPLELHVIHDRNPLYVMLSNGSIRNGYNIKIMNKTHDDRIYEVSVSDIDNAKITVQGAGDLRARYLPVMANSVAGFRIFVTSGKKEESRSDITFILKDKVSKHHYDVGSMFVSSRK